MNDEIDGEIIDEIFGQIAQGLKDAAIDDGSDREES